MKAIHLPDELIPDLLARELTGICTTCAHFKDCLYRSQSEKIIIQCELHEPDLKKKQHTNTYRFVPKARNKKSAIQGLCFTCSHAVGCDLPKENGGVWRCTDYK